MKRFIIGMSAAVLVLGFVFSDVLWVCAQEEEKEEFTLDEITVTAQMREENQQKVPIMIETISGEDLNMMGRITLEDTLAGISSAVVQKAGKELSVIIRGMDNDAIAGDSFSQVAVTLDGVFSNSFGVGYSGIYDMERVEILSGPQGTLYSRNASGGVVNMVSNNPSTDRYAASGSLELGNFSLINTKGMVNIPLSDKLALRTAFNIVRRDGFVSNGTNDNRVNSARLKFGYYPLEAMSAVLSYEYTHTGGRGQGGGVDAFEDEDDVDDPWYSSQPEEVSSTDRDYHRITLNYNWATRIGVISLIPSYTKYEGHDVQRSSKMMVTTDSGEVVTTYGKEYVDDEIEEQSYELRFTSPEDSTIEWLIGSSYYYRFWSSFGKTQENPSTAIFSNITYPLSSVFRVTVGGRYTADRERLVGYSSPNTKGPTGELLYTSSHFDYKLGVEYDLGANSMLWADHSTGYKHVIQNQASQEVKSFQVGLKNRFLDQKIQVNATAFYYDYSNFTLVASGKRVMEEGVEVSYMARAIANAEIYGIDVSTNFLITKEDRLDLSASYLNATVDSGVIKYESMQSDSTLPDEQYPGGAKLNNSPKYTVTSSYEHNFDLSNGSCLTPRLDIRYQTEMLLEFIPESREVPEDMDVDKVNTEPAHFMIDFSTNYNSSSGKWNLNGYMKNVLNHAEKTGFKLSELRIGSPRTYGVILSVKF